MSDETGEHAADDGAEEARRRQERGVGGSAVVDQEDVGGETAHDEARGDAGPVGDRVGDVAGQRRHEEHEGRLAEDEEERAEIGEEARVEQGMWQHQGLGVRQVEEGVVDGDLAVAVDDLVTAEEEAEGDEEAAGRDERDHVRHARHEDPARTPTPRLGGTAGARAGGHRPLDARGVGVVGVAQGLGDHGVAVVDRALDAGGDDRLAGEATAVAHPHVDGEDHGRRRGDGLGRKRLGARGALGLDGDRHAGPLGGGLESLGGHVGVGDARRARRDRDQRASAGRGHRRGRRRGRRGGGRSVAHGVLHQCDDLGGRSGRPETVGEVLLHQRAGELGQQLQVGDVAAGRGGDQEGQVGRAVLGTELDLRSEAGEGQGRYVDPGGAAVGDRDATREPRGRGAFAGDGVRGELVRRGRATGIGDHPREGADDLVLVGAEVGVEAHEVGGDEVGHGHPPGVSSRRVTRTSSG